MADPLDGIELNSESESDDAARAAADEAAIKRVEDGTGLQGDGSDGTKPKAPEWCPEKYARYTKDGQFDAQASAEAISKGYSELEKQFTKDRQQKPKDDESDDDGEADDKSDGEGDDDNGEEPPPPEGDVDPPLFDTEFWTTLTAEYNENDGLSEESMKILTDNIGLPPQMIEDFIEGQRARAEQYQAKVTSVLGPNAQETYDALVDWAGGVLSKAEATAFNEAIHSGDLVKAQSAIRDLKGRYVEAEGDIASLTVRGNTGIGGAPGGTAQPFASRAEQSAAINDKRYETDEAYRAKVAARIAVSTF